jgi:hypothetical protein
MGVKTLLAMKDPARKIAEEVNMDGGSDVSKVLKVKNTRKGKGKGVLLQARCGPEGSVGLDSQIFMAFGT